MKNKMLKKLISIVFAAAMATSCVSMSVGAAPAVVITAADWEQGYNRAKDLNDLAHHVYNNGYSFDDCLDLANQLEDFFNGMVCTVAVYSSQSTYKNAFEENVDYLLNRLRSTDEEERSLGMGAVIDNLYDVTECIQEQMN